MLADAENAMESPASLGVCSRRSNSSSDSRGEGKDDDEVQLPIDYPAEGHKELDLKIEDGNLEVDFKGEPPGPVHVEHLKDTRKGLHVGDRLVLAGNEKLESLETMTTETFQKILNTRPLQLRFHSQSGSPADGKSIREAKQVAAAEMANEEAEMTKVPEKVEDDWKQGVPEAEKRVFPRPNPARYKWTLRTCFEHDWNFIRAFVNEDVFLLRF